MTFRHRRPLRTSFGVSKLTSSRRSSFSSLLALQREFRRLHSADGSKHSALNYLAFGEGLLSPRLALRIERWRSRLGAHLSPVFSVSISYKTHCRETSIAKDLHVRLNHNLNNDFVQNLHLNHADDAIETRIFAFRFIRSIARVARVCHAFVAVTNSCCDHLAVHHFSAYFVTVCRDNISCMSFVTVLR